MSRERWETQRGAGHNWALILAGGEGTRLQSLTRMASGIAVPKQFCSLSQSGSLLHDAVTRASLIASHRADSGRGVSNELVPGASLARR